MDYWFYTGDEGLVPVTMEAMVHQVGPYQDYMPPNQSKSLVSVVNCLEASGDTEE